MANWLGSLLSSVWGKNTVEENKNKPDPITDDMIDYSGETLAPSAGIYADEEQTGFSDLNRAFLEIKAEQLGVPLAHVDEFVDNWYNYSRDIRNIESDNDPTKTPGTTTAKGVYQFTDDTVVSGKKRLETLGYSKRQDWNPYDSEFISQIPNNPQEWTDEQSDAMFLANMFSQSGSDQYVRGIGTGDKVLGNDAYYKFHYKKTGGPDEKTVDRVEQFRPVEEQDKLYSEYNKVDQAFTKA